jgi:hypothetical protein
MVNRIFFFDFDPDEAPYETQWASRGKPSAGVDHALRDRIYVVQPFDG